jgi:diaminohydroxyphosphoribosylaminopyrimidine deaminase / 5-amino-6-(5-phosphoribosylamino)uracil reductase
MYEKKVKEITLHEPFMNRCLDLARLGLGGTVPNPMVGSVIVHRDTIIGEGFHRHYGGPHAEVNAVNAVKDHSLLPESTLYVNLEPCSHTGKTPPCADMIIRSGMSRVVIGTPDPNPLVGGSGIRKLEEAGVTVISQVLPEKCRYLNRRFFRYFLDKRPFVILKWAQTTDGFMDIHRKNGETTKPNWISNDISRMIVHEWRSEEQAILVGTNTALLDNPKLNVREWPGRSPLRLVIDRKLRLPKTLNLFDNSYKTVVFNEMLDTLERETQYKKIDFSRDIIPQMMDWLYDEGVQSLLVEGGRQLLEGFLASGCWDEARVFTGKKNFGEGISAPAIHAIEPEKYRLREDLLFIYTNPA